MIQDQRQCSHVCFHFLFPLATAILTTSLTHTTESDILFCSRRFFLSETCASPRIVASLPFIFLRWADSTEESTRGTGGGTVCCPLRVDEHLGQPLCATQRDVKSFPSLPIHRQVSLLSLTHFSSRRRNIQLVARSAKQ